MTAPFRYPDFSEPPPGETRLAHCDGASDGGLDRLIRQRDEALDMVASMLDAMRSGATAPAAIQARAMLARAGRSCASAATLDSAGAA